MTVQQVQGGASLRIPMSYEEYLALGETKHHEYYDGLVHVHPPNLRHVQVARRLTRTLEDACAPGFLVTPEWGWRVGERQDFEPDLMIVPEQAPTADLLREAPLLVVEVTSPSTRTEDWTRKMAAYAAGGAPWYWILDPDRRELTVLRLVGSSYRPEGTFSEGRQELSEPLPVVLDLDALFA